MTLDNGERWSAHAVAELDVARRLDDAYEVGFDTLYLEYDPRSFPASPTAGLSILARSFDVAGERPERVLTRAEYYFIAENWPTELRDYSQRLVYIGLLINAAVSARREG